MSPSFVAIALVLTLFAGPREIRLACRWFHQNA
jgi:hypothetical protein